MDKKFTFAWLKAAGARAVRTFAQTAVSLIAVGAAVSDVQWVNVASVAGVAAILSLLTSIATDLPELEMPTL